MMWLDVLDSPLIMALDWRFFEEYSEPKTVQPAQSFVDDSVRRFGGGGLLPLAHRHASMAHSPLFNYKWESTSAALAGLTGEDASAFDGLSLAYTDPLTGGPVMPTIDCAIHCLRAGHRTRAHRHTTNAIYHVARGSGHSVIDGVRFDWKQSDTFCVPNWCWHEHAASHGDEAVLFTASDEPVSQALHLYREEPYLAGGGHQQITGVFGE